MSIAKVFLVVFFLSSLAATQALATDRIIVIEGDDTAVFNPATTTMYVGDRVRWLNTTPLQHTITFGPPCLYPPIFPSFDFIVEPFESTQYFEFYANTFQYFCRFHCAMGEVGEFTVIAPVPTKQTTWGGVKALYAAQTTAH